MPHDDKPVLLIYTDGRTKITSRVFANPTLKEWERWPIWSRKNLTFDASSELTSWPTLERTFRYIGDAGPYAVYAEVY